MPELAEVEYYRTQWSAGLGRVVEAVELHAEKRVFREVDTSALRRNLIGQELGKSVSHGKQMCFVFGHRHWLGVHLGMTGKTFSRAEHSARQKHDHLVLKMAGGVELIFSDPRMFGRIRYSQSESVPAWWAQLPPQVLSEAFTFERMDLFLNRRAKAPIKAVLLFQEMFPGVGNWMADEIVWRARIAPATRAGAICKQKRIELFIALKAVCADALRVIGGGWGTPPDTWLFNHRWKAGGICPKTGQPLARDKIGGRTTSWSPQWQTYRGASG